jgi:hypothetical protein
MNDTPNLENRFERGETKKGIRLSREFAIKFESKYSQRDLKRYKPEYDPEI